MIRKEMEVLATEIVGDLNLGVGYTPPPKPVLPSFFHVLLYIYDTILVLPEIKRGERRL